MSDDDFLHARPHEGLRARRGAAKVVTRFKRYVRHGPVGGMPLFLGVVDGHLFSVQTTKMVVPTLRNDGVVFDQNAANEGIGTDLAPATLRNQQRVLHVGALVVGPVIAHEPPTDLLFMTACMGSRGEDRQNNRFIHSGSFFIQYALLQNDATGKGFKRASLHLVAWEARRPRG